MKSDILSPLLETLSSLMEWTTVQNSEILARSFLLRPMPCRTSSLRRYKYLPLSVKCFVNCSDWFGFLLFGKIGSLIISFERPPAAELDMKSDRLSSAYVPIVFWMMATTFGPLGKSLAMLKNLATDTSLSLFLISRIFRREFGIKFGI